MNDNLDTSSQDAAAQNDDGQTGDKGTQEPGWNYAEGIAGRGDAPEWFKADKYQTVEDQAKAYPELESKLGSFTGAPEEYTVNIDENYIEAGVEIAADDPMIVAGMNYAKETHMSQEGFDGMVDLYIQTRMAEQGAIDEKRELEIKSLGPEGPDRLDRIDVFASKTMTPEHYEAFKKTVTDKASVELWETVFAGSQEGALNADNANPSDATSAEEVRAMQFEKDEYGNRRLQTDPEFRARYEKLNKQVHGSNPHRVVIGPK